MTVDRKSLRVDFQFRCTCGALCDLARDDKGEPAIVHPMPTCPTYNKHDHPADYLKAVREGN
jgi:hypothetical protein